RILAAMKWQNTRPKPPPDEVDRVGIAPPAVDDGWTECAAADGVDEPYRCAADRHRSNGQPANREPQPQRRTTQRKYEADRKPTERDEAARHTSNRDPADG